MGVSGRQSHELRRPLHLDAEARQLGNQEPFVFVLRIREQKGEPPPDNKPDDGGPEDTDEDDNSQGN